MRPSDHTTRVVAVFIVTHMRQSHDTCCCCRLCHLGKTLWFVFSKYPRTRVVAIVVVTGLLIINVVNNDVDNDDLMI